MFASPSTFNKFWGLVVPIPTFPVVALTTKLGFPVVPVVRRAKSAALSTFFIVSDPSAKLPPPPAGLLLIVNAHSLALVTLLSSIKGVDPVPLICKPESGLVVPIPTLPSFLITILLPTTPEAS